MLIIFGLIIKKNFNNYKLYKDFYIFFLLYLLIEENMNFLLSVIFKIIFFD